MDSMFPKKIPKRQDTSEKKKAKQYGAAALLCILAAVIMTAIKWIWGGVTDRKSTRLNSSHDN